MKKMKNNKYFIYAILAAIFYAINIPLSKILLKYIDPTIMASLLYLGCGLGIGIIYYIKDKKNKINKNNNLKEEDLIYTVGMIVLDIIAPIFLMFGIKYGISSNISLINNFEIVATTIIAYFIFKEKISKKLILAIIFLTISVIILSLEKNMLVFNKGSIFVLIATICWGLENNCTKSISNKNTYQIVTLKGIFSGLGSLVIALLLKESIPSVKYILIVLLLGFISYGLSIFLYVKAQSKLGASKTSTCYAINPFIGSILSFILLKDKLTINYFYGLILMIIGTILIIKDNKNEV